MNILRSTFMNQYNQESVASISRPLFRLVALVGESNPEAKAEERFSAIPYIGRFAMKARRTLVHEQPWQLDLFLQSPSAVQVLSPSVSMTGSKSRLQATLQSRK